MAQGWTPLTRLELIDAVSCCLECGPLFEAGRGSCRDDLLSAFVVIVRDHAYPEGLGTWSEREVFVLASILAKQVWLRQSEARAVGSDGFDHYHATAQAGLAAVAANATNGQHHLVNAPFDHPDPQPQNRGQLLCTGVWTFPELLDLMVQWLVPLAQINDQLKNDCLRTLSDHLMGHRLHAQVATTLRQDIGKNNVGTRVSRQLEQWLTNQAQAQELLQRWATDPGLRLAVAQDIGAKLIAKAERALNSGDPVLAEVVLELADHSTTLVALPSTGAIKVALEALIATEEPIYREKDLPWDSDAATLALAIADHLDVARTDRGPATITLPELAWQRARLLSDDGKIGDLSAAMDERTVSRALKWIGEASMAAFEVLDDADKGQR